MTTVAPTPAAELETARARLYSGGTLHFAEGGVGVRLSPERIAHLVEELAARLGRPRRVLLIPPDITRLHSGAGALTTHLFRRLSTSAHVELLPALGTHTPMSAVELAAMFPGVPPARCQVHDWRRRVTSVGEVPLEFVRLISAGRVARPVRCELASRLVEGDWDRILSIGQLVPHEVVGIAGHDKNLFVGVGGKDTIDQSHFLGAMAGIEAVLGRPRTPVRDLLAYMGGHLARHLPITHLCTVRSREPSGAMVTRGLFAGEGMAVFLAGAALAQAVNVERVARPPRKLVVYLEPREYRSTWLGNKAVYRTRMALADRGELLILAPGVARFGEDPGIDGLIRRHGYRGTDATLAAVAADPELATSLSAAAHLIHGSAEGRFRITYAAGGLSPADLAGVGYDSAALEPALRRYDPARLVPGHNRLPDGEEVFFVPNPAIGLWTTQERWAER